MRAVDMVVAGLALALVVFTVVYNVRRRKRGAAGCAYCDGCDAKKNRGR